MLYCLLLTPSQFVKNKNLVPYSANLVFRYLEALKKHRIPGIQQVSPKSISLFKNLVTQWRPSKSSSLNHCFLVSLQGPENDRLHILSQETPSRSIFSACKHPDVSTNLHKTYGLKSLQIDFTGKLRFAKAGSSF